METMELRKAVETLLFIADSPVPLTRLCQIVGEADTERVTTVVNELRQEYDDQQRAIQVVEIAEGFQMATRVEGAPFVRKLYSEKMTMRLSTAALETLSIVAYRQPITRAEIEEVRGVEVIAALESLLDKRLCKVVGRKETVGRPLLYGTTPEFLRHFGLRSIEDLPPLDTFKPAEAAAAADAAPQGSVEDVLGAAGAAALAELSPLAESTPAEALEINDASASQTPVFDAESAAVAEAPAVESTPAADSTNPPASEDSSSQDPGSEPA